MGTQWWPLSQMKEDGDGLHGTWSPGKSQYQSASKLHVARSVVQSVQAAIIKVAYAE